MTNDQAPMTNEASVDDYRWLISNEAAPWLAKVGNDLDGDPPTPALIRTLRTGVGASRASLLLEQVELRAKAREKFSQADQLFFTRKGLEQATDEVLARYKALRFSDCNSIADLCCGIGGDALALACDHLLTLVDRDAVSLLLATANVERSGGASHDAIAEDVGPHHLAQADAWHIDPDRRPAGKRTSRLEFGDPSVETIDALLEACSQAAIKLAPAAELPEHWQESCEREWIETRGECRQQVAWFGRLADAVGQRTATIIDANGEACSFSGLSGAVVESTEQVAAYVFDPSPSLVAANLVGDLAAALDLRPFVPPSLYLTGDQTVVHPHLQTFAVEENLPLDVRQLRAWLQARGVGRLEIKKRGVDITPEKLRPQLALTGDEERTLILTPIGKRNRALVCRRA
jgi:hypothetical protein